MIWSQPLALQRLHVRAKIEGAADSAGKVAIESEDQVKLSIHRALPCSALVSKEKP